MALKGHTVVYRLTENFCNYLSDTMASTLRWLVLTLAHFPDIQSKCLEEILGFV